MIAWSGFGATLAGGACPLLRYAFAPWSPPGEGAPRISLGPAKDLPVGEGKAAVLQGSPILAIRSPDGVVAVSSRCTHLGCLVSWNPGAGEIRCPCHGGRFDARGRVLGGPPPEDLRRIPVSLEDGEIWVGA